MMDSHYRRSSVSSHHFFPHDRHYDEPEAPPPGPSRLKPGAQLTMMRFLQDLPDAEAPPTDVTPRYHTGRLPNSKAGDGKPRLLLMGQRRWVISDRSDLTTKRANLVPQERQVVHFQCSVSQTPAKRNFVSRDDYEDQEGVYAVSMMSVPV
jgi:hypothetical protein